MKKGLLITTAIILVAYLAAAWLMGYAIERRVDGFVHQLNDANQYVRVSNNQFHRGWFTSTQDSTLEPSQAALGSGSVQVMIHNVIHHGPICGLTCVGLAAIDTHLTFSDVIQPYLTSIFGSAEPLSIHSRLGLLGGGSGQISSPAIKDTVIADGHFSSDGITIKSEYGADVDAYSLNGAMPHLLYTSKDGKRFDITGVQIDIRAKRALRSLYTGDSSIAVGQVAFGNVAGPGAFAAADIRGTSHSAIAEGFMTSAINYSVGPITAAPLALTGTNIDLTFRHLDADSAERLTAALREAGRDTTVAPQERGARMMAAAKGPAISLLEQQPEISVEQINVATATGSASMSGLIKLLGVVADDFDNGPAMTGILKKMDADMNLTIDDGFFAGLPGGAASAARMQPFVTQGLLTHDNGKFHTNIGYHGGQATFNGKPFGTPTPPQK